MRKDRPEINSKCLRSKKNVAEEIENERAKRMKAKTEAAIIIVETVAYFTLLLRNQGQGPNKMWAIRILT